MTFAQKFDRDQLVGGWASEALLMRIGDETGWRGTSFSRILTVQGTDRPESKQGSASYRRNVNTMAQGRAWIYCIWGLTRFNLLRSFVGSSPVPQPIMPLDLPVKVRSWELTVYPRSYIRRW